MDQSQTHLKKKWPMEPESSECVHTDDEWLAGILNIVGHRNLTANCVKISNAYIIDNRSCETENRLKD